jgi:hypothetical protein
MDASMARADARYSHRDIPSSLKRVKGFIVWLVINTFVEEWEEVRDCEEVEEV